MSTIKRNTQKIDYTGQVFGPFTILEAASRKRYWKVRCTNGHISERRVDILKRTKPELLHCLVCSQPPALQPAVNQAQKEALVLLGRSLELTTRAIQGVLATFGKPAPAV